MFVIIFYEKIGLLFKNLIEHCNKMALNNEEEMA